MEIEFQDIINCLNETTEGRAQLEIATLKATVRKQGEMLKGKDEEVALLKEELTIR